MDLSYRKAVASDAALIFDLAARIWRKYYPEVITVEQIEYMLATMYSEASIRKQMTDGQEYTLVFSDKQAVGYISVTPEPDGAYFLNKFYIDTDEHRKGLGSQVFSQLLKQYPDLKTVRLTVNRSNFKSINFYFKLGFKITAVADFDIGAGFFMNDFIMSYERLSRG